MIKNNLLPAFAWLGVSAFLIQPSLDPFSLLLVFRTGIIFFCLLFRELPFKKGSNFQIIIAWLSTLLPCALRAELIPQSIFSVVGFILIILGTFLVGLACVDLGRSFGISPAIRPFVKQGIYKVLNHPMYLGHLICELGFIVAAPTMQNILIFICSMILYGLRKHWESALHLNQSRC